eukprot:7626274-Pyramimonas_sp.AAC.1
MVKTKGYVTTVNITSWGSLEPRLESFDRDVAVVVLQEHHRAGSDLGALQRQVRAFGYDGIWSGAISSSESGTTGGVAILAKTSIPMTLPPF